MLVLYEFLVQTPKPRVSVGVGASEGEVLAVGSEEPGYRIPERGNVDETTGWRNSGFGTLELVSSSV